MGGGVLNSHKYHVHKIAHLITKVKVWRKYCGLRHVGRSNKYRRSSEEHQQENESYCCTVTRDEGCSYVPTHDQKRYTCLGRGLKRRYGIKYIGRLQQHTSKYMFSPCALCGSFVDRADGGDDRLAIVPGCAVGMGVLRCDRRPREASF